MMSLKHIRFTERIWGIEEEGEGQGWVGYG